MTVATVQGFLTCGVGGTQTAGMAHIYMVFDFATDEEKLQQARHKLEGWKQAFRLDKKLLYKMDRDETAGGEGDGNAVKADKAEKSAKQEKAEKATKGKGKAKTATAAEKKPEANGDVKLLVRLAFSGHEKLSEQRWVQRIPAEEPFQGASPTVVKSGEARFEEVEKKFEELD